MSDEKIMKTLNGYAVYDEAAHREIETLKGAAPGLVFDTVTDMEAYVAEHAAELRIGQDLYIRQADVPDYWWDGTQAIPVETDMTEIRKEMENLSEAIADKRTSAMWYGTTSTEPYTAEKVVITETGDFKLIKGARVGVKFLTNTVNCNSLIVDGTEQVYIHSTNDEKGEAESSSTATPVVWHNLGQVQWFTYDGEYFIVDDSIRATAANQLCGKVSVSDSVSSTGDTVASSKAVKTAYDKAVEALAAVQSLDTALLDIIGSGEVMA